jgi:hypothetical protein
MPSIRALRERETQTRFDRSRVEIYPTITSPHVKAQVKVMFSYGYGAWRCPLTYDYMALVQGWERDSEGF